MTLSEKPFLRKLHLTILFKLSITLIHIRNVFRIDRFVFLIISYSRERERVSRCIYELLTRSLKRTFRSIDGESIFFVGSTEERLEERKKQSATETNERHSSRSNVSARARVRILKSGPANKTRSKSTRAPTLPTSKHRLARESRGTLMRCTLERVLARELKRVKELNLTWRVFSTPTTFVIAPTHSIQVALIRFRIPDAKDFEIRSRSYTRRAKKKKKVIKRCDRAKERKKKKKENSNSKRKENIDKSRSLLLLNSRCDPVFQTCIFTRVENFFDYCNGRHDCSIKDKSIKDAVRKQNLLIIYRAYISLFEHEQKLIWIY